MDNRTIDEVRRNEDRLINKIKLLEKENQQLKNELEQSNAVADTNKELAESFHKEIERLKSLLKCDYEDGQSIMAELTTENKQLKEQQKEFINYLKSMLNSEKDNFSVARVKDVLEKYKEVIGSDNNA